MLLEKFLIYSKRSTSKRTEGMAPNTVRTLVPYINKYEQFADGVFNYDTIVNWLDSLKITNQSKAVLASSLGRFMWFDRFITEEEMRMLKYSYRMTNRKWSCKTIEDKVITDICSLCDEVKTYQSIRDKALILTLAMTGMRVSQIHELDINTFILGEDYITITTQMQKQTYTHADELNDVKVLPRDASIAGINYYDVMVEYLQQRQQVQKTDTLFTTRHGNALTIRGIQKVIMKYNTLFDTDITAHTFRHNLITRVVAKHGIAIGAAIAGHSSIQTTMKYVKKDRLNTEMAYREL